jgi:hypothetical protein
MQRPKLYLLLGLAIVGSQAVGSLASASLCALGSQAPGKPCPPPAQTIQELSGELMAGLALVPQGEHLPHQALPK